MGYESSHTARRRLASMAMSNRRVQDALLAMAPAADASTPFMAGENSSAGAALALELETLAQEIISTPGAGGALLAAYAEQARVLQLVAQATERAPHVPLPAPVRHAVEAAVRATRHVDAGHPGTAAARAD